MCILTLPSPLVKGIKIDIMNLLVNYSENFLTISLESVAYFNWSAFRLFVFHNDDVQTRFSNDLA